MIASNWKQNVYQPANGYKNVVYPYKRTLLGNKKNELLIHITSLLIKRSQLKECTPYDSTDVKY